MKSSFCIDLQRFMLIPTKFPLSLFLPILKLVFGHIARYAPSNKLQNSLKIQTKNWLYRYCPWMRGMAASQISCYNGIDKKASHVPL